MVEQIRTSTRSCAVRTLPDGVNDMRSDNELVGTPMHHAIGVGADIAGRMLAHFKLFVDRVETSADAAG